MIMLLTSCLNNDDKPKDWSETVTVYVSAETGEYTPWGSEKTFEGMKIRETDTVDWDVVHFKTIDGFSYEKGHTYTLKVKKTHLENPPADGSNIKYQLIKILSKE